MSPWKTRSSVISTTERIQELALVSFLGTCTCYVSPDSGLTSNKVAGLRPRLSPYSFVHHKRVCRKRCPTSLPAVGGFPPWNSYFEERQKLRLRLQTFAVLFLKSTIPFRLRHTGWVVQNKVENLTNVAKIA